MILCIDVGNSHLFGGLFHKEKIILRFRHTTRIESTSDQLGVFLKSVLAENGLMDPSLTAIVISSVVPGINYSLRAACIKYFTIDPFFLQTGVKTGLNIKVSNLGTDMVATAIAAVNRFPNHPIIVVDFGTATTFTAINEKRQLVAQVIQVGINVAMRALQTNTAKLPAVPIIKANSINGKNSICAIQSGLYYGQLGAVREITKQLQYTYFDPRAALPTIVIGTGGFAHLFSDEILFNHIITDLVLHGLYHTLQLNLE